MLIFSLILTLGFLAIANTAARRVPPSDTLFWLPACAGTFLMLCMSPVVSPVFLIQALLLALIWINWRTFSNRPKHFHIASILATAIAYIYPALTYVENSRQYDHLRELYPVQPLDSRLPPAAQPQSEPLPKETLARLSAVESDLEVQRSHRNYMLGVLHKNQVDAFADTAGFGVGRMIRTRTPTEKNLKPDDHPPVPQPSSPGNPSSLFDGSTALNIAPGHEAALDLHQASLTEFAFPEGFGYLAAPRQSAGFQSHRFRQLPTAPKLEVQRVELIGLLRHKEPVVYETDNLPVMTEVATAPTRKLDVFESTALAKLRTGEDVIVGEAAAGSRMVGAIRMAKQCASCHDGNRGDLLGAFTYTLRPAK